MNAQDVIKTLNLKNAVVRNRYVSITHQLALVTISLMICSQMHVQTFKTKMLNLKRSRD